MMLLCQKLAGLGVPVTWGIQVGSHVSENHTILGSLVLMYYRQRNRWTDTLSVAKLQSSMAECKKLS